MRKIEPMETDMDPHHIYRPLLDLIGWTEGTDAPRGRGYNETLGYGAYTNGPVNLTAMTLDQIDALQTAMLKHPRNSWNSSAVGRYQIIRTTMRTIRETLNLRGDALFNEAMQDRMACFLLGKRGIDAYIAGRLSEAGIITELAKEWASLPTPAGKGYYGDQKAKASVAQVQAVLYQVKARAAGAPKPSPTPRPPVAQEPEERTPEPVTHSKRFWTWLTTGGGTAALPFVDWRVQILLVLVICGFAIYAIATMPAVRQKLGLPT